MTSGYLRGSNNLLAGASAQGGYTIEESLRFNSSQSSYLSRTPASAGDRKTWTWSGWVKRGTLGSIQDLFLAKTNSNSDFSIRVGNDDTFSVRQRTSAVLDYSASTSAVFRDPSAWYHIIVVFDTTQTTSSDRIKLYVNEQSVALSGSYPSLNSIQPVNNTIEHQVGADTNASRYFDGYLTEVNFIDGQALTPSSFGEYNATTGVWQPVGYTGTYGNNGFYLPMKLDNTTEGFNTVTWEGNSSNQNITGVGFSPDFVWVKGRDTAYHHDLFDSVRGVSNYLRSNTTQQELTYSGYGVTSFNTDGFNVTDNAAGDYEVNKTGQSYVGWCWDAGNTTVSNTDGSITSSVRSNPAYGFSVVTYTGTGANATVGHGLGAAPAMIICKRRTTTGTNWETYHQALGNTGGLRLNSTVATITSSAIWNNTSPTSTVFTVGGGSGVNTNTADHLAYCFSEIAGYSKFGSYSGDGTTNGSKAINVGFRPGFVMIKRTDGAGVWLMFDGTRIDKGLYANSSLAETTWPAVQFNITDTGFTVGRAGNGDDYDNNDSGDTYIYMAFKDTREYAYWLDDSGNNNDWQPNGGITTQSTVTDTPTPYADGGNYAVLNPLDSSYTPTDANLNVICAGTLPRSAIGSMFPSSGKWYSETLCVSNGGGGDRFQVGFVTQANSKTYPVSATDGAVYVAVNGALYVDGVAVSYGAVFIQGDIIGIALDIDTNEITFYKNNVSQGTYTGKTFNGAGYGLVVGHGSSGSSSTFAVNFGQRPFTYTPPTGFKSLHTGNLPDVAIENGSEYMAASLWTGDQTARTITNTVNGVSFQPDLVWSKSRSFGESHRFNDSVRGGNGSTLYTLFPNETSAEDTGTALTGFVSNGFTMAAGSLSPNVTGRTYVGWQWKAGGAAVTNTAGSITSQVSASPTAGFSVVTYTGTSVNATVGHGLGVAPKMVIVKKRIGGPVDWHIYHASANASPATGRILFNTAAWATDSTAWNNTVPTSTVVSLGTSLGANNNTETYVAYCFSEVPGYSKFGSYTGNGSADGPFVYLGFRPKFVMVKSSTEVNNWWLYDSSRSPYNAMNELLRPDLSNAEVTQGYSDFLSNGWKVRNTGQNNSGQTYIYMAFAENPFKNSLAR